MSLALVQTHAFPSTDLPERCSARPLRVALAGYGHVGQALAARLSASERYEVSAILLRDPTRQRAVLPPCGPTTCPDAFLSQPADIVVDVLSCDRTGARITAEAFARRRHVASASKRVVSSYRDPLHAAASASGTRFLYAASVGGGAPVLETVATARTAGPIVSVAGILNGTVNYILTRLAEGDDYATALAAAQVAGFAEADPHEDVSGNDAAAKIRLIAAEAFGISPGDLPVEAEALTPVRAAEIAGSGERWVQVARVQVEGDGALSASVRLQPRRAVPDLPAVDHEWNCALVTLEGGAQLSCSGPGAGGAPTAAAIHADLERIRASLA